MSEFGNENQNAFPDENYPGLTKREYMATQIMAGFASDPDTGINIRNLIAASAAVAWADELLKELEK
jgi:hypothetical protein